ncbi:MAG: AbgT family transporter [Prevotella sp.]|nr:AbgT family transporter [Prevotella sp.]
MKSKVASILVVLQLVVVFMSWLITAVVPQLGTRSLLSGVGIRWFLGHFADNLAHPTLVWLVLFLITWGAWTHSTLPTTLQRFFSRHPLMFRQRLALRVVVVELILAVIVMLLLTAVPQAILLSATGSLFPSSFSNSLIPIITFIVSLVSVSFGLASGAMHSVGDIYRALTIGLRAHGDLLLIYILAMQLYVSLAFIIPDSLF